MILNYLIFFKFIYSINAVYHYLFFDLNIYFNELNLKMSLKMITFFFILKIMTK